MAVTVERIAGGQAQRGRDRERGDEFVLLAWGCAEHDRAGVDGKSVERTLPTAGNLAGGEKRRGDSSEVMVSLTVAVVNSMSLL